MLPDLPSPHAQALREARAMILDRFDPVAIVASGTIIRGNPSPSSDLDIVVIHEHPWRQRVQCFFNDIPAELFVNPARQIRKAFAEEAREARPVLAHMLSTGQIVFDRTGVVLDLQAEARDSLSGGPQVEPAWLELRRYGIATSFEDAVDLEHVDADRARTLALGALTDAIDWWFPANGRWRPRSRSLFTDFQQHDPVLGDTARQAIRASDLGRCLELVATVLTATIGETGFFAWESSPETVAP